jgi:hypothetical protein
VRRGPKLLLLAPLLFGAHVLEEAPGYLDWFNRVAKPPIIADHFLSGQIPPFLITAVLAGLAAWTSKTWALLLLLVWSTHFIFANALYHVIASIATASYSPGLITAVVLYLPFFVWFMAYLRKQGIADWLLLLFVALFGLPMYLQTYMVSFRGMRFF